MKSLTPIATFVVLLLPTVALASAPLDTPVTERAPARVDQEDGWYEFVEGVLDAPLTNQLVDGFVFTGGRIPNKLDAVYVIPEVDFESLGVRFDLRF